MTVLDRILERKREEVAALRAGPGRAELAARAARAETPRGFARALVAGPSPRDYAASGAAALSVLTDREFFRGELADLRAARAACALPVLRKDFTIDPLQLFEARAEGADAALLIVAALADAQLRELLACARELGLDALVEVHDEPELERALAHGAALVGINNRDLRDFKTDVGVTRALLPRAAGRVVVSESGLDSPEVVRALAAEGASAFLVGEALMRAPDPGAALRRLRGVP